MHVIEVDELNFFDKRNRQIDIWAFVTCIKLHFSYLTDLRLSFLTAANDIFVCTLGADLMGARV